MHCDDFSRTDAERRSRLEAPISRRRLLQAGLGATRLALRRAARCRSRAPSRPPRRAPQAAPQRAGARQRLRPRRPGPARHGRPRRRLRPLRRPAPGAEGRPAARRWPARGFGVHPALGEGLNGGLKGLFDRGRLGFIPGIDYANPDLSHFNSRHFWETGLDLDQPGARAGSARWTDRHGGRRQPVPGAVDGRRPVAAAARQPQPGRRASSRPTTPSRGSPACGASGRTA